MDIGQEERVIIVEPLEEPELEPTEEPNPTEEPEPATTE